MFLAYDHRMSSPHIDHYTLHPCPFCCRKTNDHIIYTSHIYVCKQYYQNRRRFRRKVRKYIKKHLQENNHHTDMIILVYSCFFHLHSLFIQPFYNLVFFFAQIGLKFVYFVFLYQHNIPLSYTVPHQGCLKPLLL